MHDSVRPIESQNNSTREQDHTIIAPCCVLSKDKKKTIRKTKLDGDEPRPITMLPARALAVTGYARSGSASQ